MARIRDAELERLQRQTDLVALVQASGVALRRHGADLVGRCPFHEDEGTSLRVSPPKGHWHCLGACQANGSAIHWVMRTERVSFRHAVELLHRRGSTPTESLRLAPLVCAPKGAALSVADQALLKQVVDYYHETLTASPEAIEYLDRRGLNDVALIDRFRLGFANRTLGYRLPATALKAGAQVRGQLQRLGILRPSGHEHLLGSIVVPVLSERGAVAQCYGRKITPHLRAGTPDHLYLPRPHTAVWHVEALRSSTEIILCEALLDAMTFWVAGHRNVITSYGVSGFTDAHWAALQLHGTARVLIAYDADPAGDQAAERLADELTRLGIDAYRLHFPRGQQVKDANGYALEHAPASESLGTLLRGATWLGRAAPLVTGADLTPAESVPPLSPLAAVRPVAAPAVAAASPVPKPSAKSVTIASRSADGNEVLFAAGERTYRVRGLAKWHGTEMLRVNVLARRGIAMHVDTLDLYTARSRTAFIEQAAQELGVGVETVKREIGTVLLALEGLAAERLSAVSAQVPAPPASDAMHDTERAAALALLTDPQLVDRIVADLAATGMVGEASNALVVYLATVSRKLPAPLAVIIQSASAAGKTSLMEAVLALVPPEDRVQYSAMTGQALFYLGETDLRHRVLAIVEEGAVRASNALKLLQSEGQLTIASTGKDPTTGRLMTETYRVQGPVMILLTTTTLDLDEELLNRALVLTVDESAEQTRAIHRRQRDRRTLEGLLAHAARDECLALHRDAQRLLHPLSVVNPFAPQLTFVDGRTRTRRDHEKYLTLIDSIALLHQHQREVKIAQRGEQTIAYVEVTPADIALANHLAGAVLARALDELPPQTRRCLVVLDRWLTAARPRDRRFTAREARAVTGLGPTQMKRHLHRLVELEYSLMHRAPHGIGVTYELCFDASAGTDDLPALAAALAIPSDDAVRSGAGRPRVGPGSALSRGVTGSRTEEAGSAGTDPSVVAPA